MLVREIRILVTVFRSEGLRAVLKRLAFRFLHRHTFVVYRLRLDDSLPVVQSPEGIELKEVSVEELKALRRGRTDLPEYFYRDQTGTVGRCWVGLRDGRLGFIFWATYRPETGLVRLGKTDVEACYAYSLKDFRGKHLTGLAHLMAARAFYQEGYTSMFGIPHSSTPGMHGTLRHCGFKKVGEIKRLGFLTWPRVPVDFSKVPDAETPMPLAKASQGA